MRGTRLAALLLMTFPLVSGAHDLGVRGKTFPIAEESFLKMLMQKAAKANWKAADEKMKKKAQWDLRHFPQQALERAPRTLTTYYSPGIILKKSIRAPVDTASGYHWQVIYPKGTHVNPLRRGIVPVTRMLFFNEDRPRQVAFMKAAVKAYPYFILPVALGGNIPKEAKSIGRPMYYAYPTIIQRFQILATPALLGVGRGAYRYDMAVTYFGPKARKTPAQAPQEIHAAWFGLTGKHQVKMLPRAPNTLHGKQSLWPDHKPGKIMTGGSADIYEAKAIRQYNKAHGTNYQQ